jgi:hypothetical protein
MTMEEGLQGFAGGTAGRQPQEAAGLLGEGRAGQQP